VDNDAQVLADDLLGAGFIQRSLATREPVRDGVQVGTDFWPI